MSSISHSLSKSIAAQAQLHHAYLLGLQLMVASNKDSVTVGEWMFQLFRRQHREKFLSSFNKLGLSDLPHAVACAQYHVMSNGIGGVPVEYIAESDRKAWVRFRYPRWMYHGPTICGVPVEVSRGFLRGWYAYNGVSLNNPRLGFVCVSEDMTGEFGFCGYFKEYETELDEDQRLQFAHGELPPRFNADEQPQLPARDWTEQRLQKANRNYAIDYIRNGIIELAKLLGEEEAIRLASRAAKLIGLQYLQETLLLTDCEDGDLPAAAQYLASMFEGMGDRVEVKFDGDRKEVEVSQFDLRIVRDLELEERNLLLVCWQQLWEGAMSSYQVMKRLDVDIRDDSIVWRISERQ